MSRPGVAVQLIVFGKQNQEDIEGVLRDVSAAGYDGIEAGNMFENYGEDMTARYLSTYELMVSGAHFGYGDYTQPEKLNSHILYAQAVGLKNLMCSGVADTKTIQGYQDSAKLFNDVGKRLADEGLRFQYHNHAWEFEDLGGGTNGMDILSQETNPAYVKFNIDVFWVWYASKDPVEFIRANRERAGYFHFKDGTRGKDLLGRQRPDFIELGQGDVDLRAAYQACVEVGAEWIVAEQDSTKLSASESVSISRAYLRDHLGI